MHPLKPKDIIDELAKESDLSDIVISDIINFYYDKIHSSMDSAENLKIYIPKLGSFVVRKKKIKSYIKKYKDIVNKIKNTPDVDMTYTRHRDLYNSLNRLNKLKFLLVKLNSFYHEFKNINNLEK